MSTTLDGQRLFDQQQLEIELESTGRDSLERSIAGLDGVLSIDIGQRGRVVKQKGALRAPTATQMDERINAISAFLDGDTHTLVTKDGQTIENVRVDVFKVKQKRKTGSGLVCDYEIVYRQLVI